MKRKKIKIDQEAIDLFYTKKQIKTIPASPIVPTYNIRLKVISKTETKIIFDYDDSESFHFEPFVLMTYQESSKSFQYEKKGLLRFVILNTVILPIIALVIAIINYDPASELVLDFLAIIGFTVFLSVFLFWYGKDHLSDLSKHIKKQVGNVEIL